ncbi:MAG: hypothetical protein KGM17_07080 [Sphingomonadales bacterium]|nr:hypothetical protein [Sphingomonadales bacterium]
MDQFAEPGLSLGGDFTPGRGKLVFHSERPGIDNITEEEKLSISRFCDQPDEKYGLIMVLDFGQTDFLVN